MLLDNFAFATGREETSSPARDTYHKSHDSIQEKVTGWYGMRYITDQGLEEVHRLTLAPLTPLPDTCHTPDSAARLRIGSQLLPTTVRCR